MTPYEEHQLRNHKTTRYSPNGVLIIEECAECPKRFIHNLVEIPVGMRDSFYDAEEGDHDI